METLHTLVMTDLVDSTALNARIGDAVMIDFWAEHDRCSRELGRRFGGLEVDRSDGFLMLFDDPALAALFVVEYHRMLAAMPHAPKARVGLHVGGLTLRETSPEERAQGAKRLDVVGLAKAVVARLMQLADGGQTLASPAAVQALGAAAVRRVSHGFWRLKGLPEPLEVFEVGADEAPFVPPRDGEKALQVTRVQGQWVSVRDVPHHLPAERDAFFGRMDHLRAIARHFTEGARLVTVLGAGGTGKTRLAQRYGWAWLGQYPGGVYFCDLSAATSVDGVLHAVARALALPLGTDPVAQLAQSIAARGRCLLIVDNVEQVARHAGAALGAWLDAAAEARLLVTSRESLGLAGEITIGLEGLPPDDAVALFDARAAALNPHHMPASHAPETARQLAALLDGLPLALELAAARTTVLTPAELLDRMGDHLRLLAVKHGRPERQATLRATIAWSWNLLDGTERAALAQLSVFEGGFTLAAAEAVLDLADGPSAVLDTVQSLMSKSLLRRDPGGRFGLLRTIQNFAAEQLAPREGAATRQCHWRHFAQLDEAIATAPGCPELDNLVAACRRATAADDADAAAGALQRCWAALRQTGPLRVALQLSDAVVALPGASPLARASAHAVAAAAQFAMSELAPARLQAETALALLPADADALAARVHDTLGEIDSVAGRFDDAAAHLQQARALAERTGQAGLRCQVLNALGALAADRGLLDEAQAHYRQALTLAESAGLVHWQCGLAGNLGTVHYALGRLDEARAAFEASLALARAQGHRRWQGSALCNLGLIHHDEGRPADALPLLGEALETARLIGHHTLEHHARCIRGLARDALGDLAGASEDFAAAVAGADAAGDPRSAGQFRIHLGSAMSRRGLHDEARSCLTRAREETARVGDPLALVRVLCALGEAEVRAGQADAARLLLDEAEQRAATSGAAAALAGDLDKARSLIRPG